MISVTQLLEAANRGDRQAAADLLPLVYDELRKLAAAKLAHEKGNQTLNSTALVHEAYLRLVGDQQFDGRGHFFAAAAEAMRRILVDSARRKATSKRGEGQQRVDIELANLSAPEKPDELLAIHEALDALAVKEPQTAELVKLRYFVGMSLPEAAAILGLSTRTAERLWTFGRAWLRQAIEEK
jgi:RNA polymerase sigma factor (TIGR02999 family)